MLAVSDYIEVVDVESATTHFEPVPFYIFAIFVASVLIFSTFSIFYYGIRKAEGESRVKMINFFMGLVFMIISLGLDVIGNLFENEVLFDTLLFVSLSIGNVFLIIPILKKKKD